jgi:CDGSH-type Zn-finger protein
LTGHNRNHRFHEQPTGQEKTMSDEPVIAQKGPYPVELTRGKTYHWCACGRSQNQPFCDGSHQGTGLEPVSFVAEKTETGYLCGCKRTTRSPFCDGTHNSL